MKKAIALFIITTLFTGLVSAQDSGIDSSYANVWYQQRVDFFKKLPDNKKEIVFLGNSLTEGGEWQEVVYKKNVVNRGISGDVTYGILARLDEVLSSKPSKIFLLMGTNDMKRGTPSEAIIANYVRLIKTVKSVSPKTKLYIQSLLPLNMAMLPQSYNKLSSEKVNQLNEQLKALCDQYKLTYVDLHPAFADEKGQLKKEYSLDGLHLKSAAYIIWADYLRKIKAL